MTSSTIPFEERTDHIASLAFYMVHLVALVTVLVQGLPWAGLAWALGMYVLRMFGLTAGYHRYFAHRSYKTSRAFQFLLALLGTCAVQKGVLWWAAHHRDHHRYSDTPDDIHSPRKGFWWSHAGWILCRRFVATKHDRIRDFGRFAELRWLNKNHLLVDVALAAALYFAFGWTAMLWGFFVSTAILWHGTFTINSLAHLFGRKRYATTDTSRNSFLLAVITLGEGWHNNHHYYQSSTSQGFYWWELDVTYYVLRAMSWLGLVWDLRTPPRHVRDARPASIAVAPDAILNMEPATA